MVLALEEVYMYFCAVALYIMGLGVGLHSMNVTISILYGNVSMTG